MVSIDEYIGVFVDEFVCAMMEYAETEHDSIRRAVLRACDKLREQPEFRIRNVVETVERYDSLADICECDVSIYIPSGHYEVFAKAHCRIVEDSAYYKNDEISLAPLKVWVSYADD